MHDPTPTQQHDDSGRQRGAQRPVGVVVEVAAPPVNREQRRRMARALGIHRLGRA